MDWDFLFQVVIIYMQEKMFLFVPVVYKQILCNTYCDRINSKSIAKIMKNKTEQ